MPCGLLAWTAHLKSVISLRNKFRKEMCYICKVPAGLGLRFGPHLSQNRGDVMADCY